MLLRAFVVFALLGVGFAPTSPVAVQEPAKPKKYALLVGVNKYEHAEMNRPQPLQYAEADVTELAELLRASDYEVDLLTGDKATKKAVDAAIANLKTRGNSDGVVLVALAGHGMQLEKDKDAYFCPFDCTLREAVRDGKKAVVDGKAVVEPDPSSLVKLTDIVNQFALSKAGTRILLADCCRNDQTSGRGRGVGSGIKTDELPANTAVLLSCSQGQQAWEDKRWGHGAFFYHVLQGLRDGHTTVTKLQSYLEEAVPNEVKKLDGAPEQDPHPLINGRRLDFGLVASAYNTTGVCRFVHFGKGQMQVGLILNDYDNKLHLARVYDAVTGQPVTPPLRHNAYVTNCEFSPDGARIATASSDKTARVWDAKTGKPLTPPLTHDKYVFCATFSPDSSQVVTASEDKTARVWNAMGGKPVTPPLKHEEPVCHAVFSPDGLLVVTASFDNTARVWDARNGQPITPSLKHDGLISHAYFSPDSSRVVTASFDNTARVWDAKSGQPVTPPLKHDNSVPFAAFSPDGLRVITASYDNTARVWDAKTGQPITPALKHNSTVFFAAFSPSGSRVVTASWDGTARVWDAKSGQPLTPNMKHDWGVNLVAFTLDGVRIVVSDKEKAYIWDATSGQRLKKITITAD